MNNFPIPYKVMAFAAALLFLSVASMPYGYYNFVRIVVCGCAGINCYRLLNAGDKSAWPWIWVVVAILFNPIAPIHMTKEVWMAIDAACGVLFGYAAYRAYQGHTAPAPLSPPETPLAKAAKEFDSRLRAQGYEIKSEKDSLPTNRLRATFVSRKRVEKDQKN